MCESLCRLKKKKNLHIFTCASTMAKWIEWEEWKKKPQSLQPHLEKCLSKSEIRSRVFCSIPQRPGIILCASVRMARFEERSRETTCGFCRPSTEWCTRAGTLQQVLSFCNYQRLRKNWSNAMGNMTSAAVFHSIWINIQTKLKLQSLWRLPIIIFSWVLHYLEIKGDTD